MAVNGHNGINGSHGSRALRPGIYAPIPSFFLPTNEDLDLVSFEAHVVRLAAAGVGPLLAGSMGEAIHLSHSERIQLIHAARNALDKAGMLDVPIVVGTGAASTRETIELTIEAANAGADYAIVIAGGYFAGRLLKSPIPVIIYNFPGASGGIDLDSDLITELAIECPNTCGVKLTCGNVGKLTRIADVVSSSSFASDHPRKNQHAPFLVLGGYADFILSSTFVSGHGAITGLANVSPHAIVKLYQLSQAARKDPSILPEAQRLQGIIARADFTIAKTSIAGTKYLIEQLYGYGGAPRKPLLPMEADASQQLWDHPHTQDLVHLERGLGGKLKI
ncbi:dihydrodipicolinate synthetase [Infundibulicybe gibba]|nr:dihydrodipicolinate synthetase [Infundibulicybe gibba]